MEEIIKHIDMEMLKSYSYQGSYTDEYLFFTDKLENIFQENKNVKLEFFLMIYCIEGEIKLELNNSPHHLHQKDLIISLPNTIIGQVLASPNHKIKIICFSNRLLQRLTQTEKYTWKWVCYIQKNPTLNPQLHSRSATYIKRNGLLIRKITIKSSRPFQCAYHPLTP